MHSACGDCWMCCNLNTSRRCNLSYPAPSQWALSMQGRSENRTRPAWSAHTEHMDDCWQGFDCSQHTEKAAPVGWQGTCGKCMRSLQQKRHDAVVPQHCTFEAHHEIEDATFPDLHTFRWIPLLPALSASGPHGITHRRYMKNVHGR